MFQKILVSLLASLSLALLFTGCASRDENEEYDKPPMQEETPAESPQEELPPDNNPPSEEEKALPDAESGSPEQKEDSAVMSRDWDQIGSLDAEKLGWGPGGPVDDNNRSQGAISYQEKFGKYDADFIGPKDEKKICLTFDEGYENGYTSKILDVLKEKEVQGVFFVTGHYVESNPDLIKRMIDEGHIVGNHTWGHPSLPDVSLEEAEKEVLDLHNYVKENFDYTMKLFRFPSGEFNEQTLLLLKQLGYRCSFWSFAYKDWIADDQPDNNYALNNMKEKVHPGAIYLLHAVSSTNTEVLPQFIDDMRMDGYEFCSYDDMIKNTDKKDSKAKEDKEEEKETKESSEQQNEPKKDDTELTVVKENVEVTE